MMKSKVEGNTKQINALLNQLPAAMQAAAFEKGLRPAGKVVEKRLKELTPRSSKTGTTKKWSEQTQTKRSGEMPLWKTTATKVWRARSGPAIALVGYRWPKGNKAHFIVEGKGKTRKVVLWGKRNKGERQKLDILKRSLDERRKQSADAFVRGVKKEVDKQVEKLAIQRKLDRG